MTPTLTVARRPSVSALLDRFLEHRNEGAHAASMSLPGVADYARCFQTVPGWFGRTDLRLFDFILGCQLRDPITANILEIGCYQGKSAILLGYGLRDDEAVVVCDLFGSDPANVPTEGLAAYEGLTVETFAEHYNRFHSQPPELHVCASSDLGDRLDERLFRFVHIDGSHAYDCVKADIQTAIQHASQGAVIAVDDYRSAHTPGVAAAVWEAAAAGLLYPFCISRTKLYAAASGSDHEHWLETCRAISEADTSWESEVHVVLGVEVMRLQYLPSRIEFRQKARSLRR
jgi:hypothetical protein